MKKFRVFFVNNVTGKVWFKTFFRENANEVWEICNNMLDRDTTIEGIYLIEKYF